MTLHHQPAAEGADRTNAACGVMPPVGVGPDGEARNGATPDAIWGLMAERGDVLAYLARKLRAARTVAGNDAASPDSREQARHWVRLLEITRDELAHGLHEGVAATEAALSRGKA